MKTKPLWLLIPPLLAACQSLTPGSTDRHALFATEPPGAPGTGEHPGSDATRSLERQAAALCPSGYERVDEQVHPFQDGKQWIWWVRCGGR
jgi:hypothetical protein